MTDFPERAERAFDAHEAFESADDGFVVTTTAFDATVTAEESEANDWAQRYTLTVRTPMLSSVVTNELVGPVVEDGWFETLCLRLEDAPQSVRESVELDEYALDDEEGEAVATFVFEWGNADRAPDIAKAFAEYVEGTYVEGIIPGYEYGEPVSGLLSRARQSGEREGSGDATPL